MMNNFQNVKRQIEGLGYEITYDNHNEKLLKGSIRFNLTKKGRRYFAKINIRENHRVETKNELQTAKSLAQLFSNDENIKILVPKLESLKNETVLLVYPYLDIPAISNEAKDFKDFNVAQKDYKLLAEIFTKFLSELAKIKKETYLDKFVKTTEEKRVLNHFRNLLKENTYRGNEIVMKLCELYENITDYAFAISDFQYQYMAWDTETRILYLWNFKMAKTKAYTWDISHLMFLSHANYFSSVNFAEILYRNLMRKLKTSREKEKFQRYLLYNSLYHCLFYLNHFKNESKRYKLVRKYVDYLLL